jgi:hypothetical protein
MILTLNPIEKSVIHFFQIHLASPKNQKTGNKIND